MKTRTKYVISCVSVHTEIRPFIRIYVHVTRTMAVQLQDTVCVGVKLCRRPCMALSKPTLRSGVFSCTSLAKGDQRVRAMAKKEEVEDSQLDDEIEAGKGYTHVSIRSVLWVPRQ